MRKLVLLLNDDFLWSGVTASGEDEKGLRIMKFWLQESDLWSFDSRVIEVDISNTTSI